MTTKMLSVSALSIERERSDFALDDVAEILAFRDQNEPPCQYVMDVIGQKITETEQRIADLQRLRDELWTLLLT